MQCFIELWRANESWLKLSKIDREAYLAQIGPHLQALLSKGVEIICWGENNPDTTHRAGYSFFSVWKFPSDEMKKDFESLVEAAGWYNYFFQENVSGYATTPDVIIERLIDL